MLVFKVLNIFSFVTSMLTLLAWSFISFEYPVIMNFNSRTLFYYSSFYDKFTSFLLEINTTDNLFIMVLIFHSLYYWFCFSNSLRVLRVCVLWYSPFLLALSVIMIWVTLSTIIIVRFFGSGLLCIIGVECWP